MESALDNLMAAEGVEAPLLQAPAPAPTPTPADGIVLRGCVNHPALQMTVCEPWNYQPGPIPDEARENKASWGQWAKDTSTRHLYYTATEGVNEGIRITAQNPPRFLHGFIADYDTTIDASMLATLAKRCPADFPPNWQTATFSGGVRLVWLFEKPLAVDHAKLAEKFLRVAMRELRLKKLLPGLDEGAFMALNQIYEVGTKWVSLSTKRLPANVLNFWMTEAAGKLDWKGLGDVIIPIDKVWEEVQKQYPGRWDGEFEVGKRGVVFFDPSSKNPNAAIIKEGGVVCFGQEKVFYPWDEILGREFVQKFQAEKIGAAVQDVWFDGKYYFRKNEGVWQAHGKDDFGMWLKVRHGIDGSKDRGDTASELDRTLVFVQEHRRVSGVIPQVYCPDDILIINGQRFLNCAAVKVCQPAEHPQSWGQDFPWLAQFLDTCWDAKLVPCTNVRDPKPPMPARDIFLAWFQHYYRSALQGELLKGQALFIAGGAGAGKTLLGTNIIRKALGGAADASDFLNSDTQFNRELLEVALWNVDDNTVGQDPKAHQKFSEMVKRVVANPFFNYRAMYRDAQRVLWSGRIVITLNDDASSIRILPNLESSIEDKVIILKFSDARRSFPDWHELDETISREMPFFLRWLLDWVPSPDLLGEKRFVVNSYIHEDLRTQSLHSGGVGDLLELVDLWIRRAAPEETYKDGVWEGTASDWMAEVMSDDNLKPLIQKFTPRMLGRKFTEAARVRDSGIEVSPTKHKGNGNHYRIHLTANAGTGPSHTTKQTVVVDPLVESLRAADQQREEDRAAA